MAYFVFDYKCNKCGHIGEAWTENQSAIICSECASLDVKIVWLAPPRVDNKWSPYKMLDKRPPDDKNPTVSVPRNYKGD